MEVIDSEMHPVLTSSSGVVQVSYDELIKCMDNNKIDQAVILPSWKFENGPARVIEEVAKRNPKRLIPFCKFFYDKPPLPGGWGDQKERALRELNQMLSSGVFKGVGEINLGENHAEDPYRAVREYFPFMDIIAKFKVPVEFHTGFGFSGPLPFLDPKPLDILASTYPEIPFLINHCGYMLPPFGDISLYMAMENDNVYLQISNLHLIKDQPGRELYKKWVSNALAGYGVGAGKLIFGTDWIPAHEGERENDPEVSYHVKALSEIKMSEDERSMVMGGNLKKLLRI